MVVVVVVVVVGRPLVALHTGQMSSKGVDFGAALCFTYRHFTVDKYRDFACQSHMPARCATSGASS